MKERKMAEKLQVTIVGLGLIGASAGLALRRYPDRVRVVGHDKNPSISGKAKAMGAVEHTDWNLINAVAKADRIILALPYNEVQEVLTAVAEDLKPGCVILSMASVDQPVLARAAEVLPKNAHLVSGHPILLAETQDTASARADLFDNKMFCLTPSNQVAGDAVNLASDLAEALGAKPFFLDPVEYDGLMAGVEHLPILLAGLLMSLTAGSSGWHDMRKLAGSQFYTSTLLIEDDPQAAASSCIANRENLLRWMDLMWNALADWRGRIAEGDVDALTEVFRQGLSSRQQWLHALATGNWSEEVPAEMPTAGSTFRGMFGLRGFERKPKRGRE
jgi:prephenate dehydrogenase